MNGAAAGGAAAAAAAARARAIKASGAIVSMDVPSWLALLARQQRPLVIHARSGFFSESHHYLTSYRGLTFFTRSPKALELPPDSERIEADKIWIP